MTKIVWVSLLPPELDRGGGATYSRLLQHLLTDELEGNIEARLYVLPRSHLLRKLKLALSMIISLVTPFSGKIAYCFSLAVIRAVRSSKADILVCDHVETAYLLRIFGGSATFLIMHNVEGELMIRRGGTSPGLRRWMLRREGRRLLEFEKWALGAAGSRISLSRDDVATLSTLSDLPIRHVAPLFNYPARSEPIPELGPLRLGFVGNLGWWPNAEGLEWFLNKVYPHVSHTKLPLHIIGDGDTSRFARAGVVLHGFLPSIESVWHQFDVMIVPVQSGSGVSIKTAEALYNGMPLLSTPMGVRGLPDLNGTPGITIEANADAWIAILRRWQDGERPAQPRPTISQTFAYPQRPEGVANT